MREVVDPLRQSRRLHAELTSRQLDRQRISWRAILGGPRSGKDFYSVVLPFVNNSILLVNDYIVAVVIER